MRNRPFVVPVPSQVCGKGEALSLEFHSHLPTLSKPSSLASFVRLPKRVFQVNMNVGFLFYARVKRRPADPIFSTHSSILFSTIPPALSP